MGFGLGGAASRAAGLASETAPARFVVNSKGVVTDTLAPSDIAVSRSGRPGLETGDWVMKGGVDYRNYLLSGKWQPWDPVFRNQFAPFGSGQQFAVPPSMLQWPGGIFGVPKGLLGQRIYVGPGIPLP